MTEQNKMTVKDLMLVVLSLNPHEIVKCDMDNFSPYTYVDLPVYINDQRVNFTDEEDEEFNEWIDLYLSELVNRGVEGCKEYLKQQLTK